MPSVVQRLEQVIVCTPFALLLVHAVHHVLTSSEARPPLNTLEQLHSTLREEQTPHLRLAHHAFLVSFEWLVKADGVGRLAGLVWMALLSMVVMVFGEKSDKHQRKGAGSGMLIGSLAVPLMFACQLCLHQPHGIATVATSLFWLSLACSTTAIIAAYSGDSVSDPTGPGLTELFTACLLAQIAFAVQDTLMSVDTLVVLFIFAYVLHFLLHTLRFSFTPGEAICVSTLLTLLLSNGVFSLLGHLLHLYPKASWWRESLANWTERAMILDVSAVHSSRRAAASPYTRAAPTLSPQHAQSVAFYNALLSLHLGVLLLGVVWFAPFALQWKRARTQRARIERKEKLIEVEVREREEQPGLERKEENRASLGGGKGGSNGSKESAAPANGLHTSRLKRRKAAKLEDTDDGATEQASLLRGDEEGKVAEGDAEIERKEGHRSSKVRQSPSPPTLLSSYSPSIIWLLMVSFIFLLVYPYIFLEMAREPFRFVWEFVVTAVPEENGKRYHTNALPPSLLFSALHSSHHLTLLGLDLTFFAQNIRLTIAGAWVVIVGMGVAVCAPMGKAKDMKAVEGGAVELPAAGLEEIPQPQQEGVVRGRHVNIDAVHVAAAVAPVSPVSASLLSRIPNILIRKYYHFLASLLFLPAILIEPGFTALAIAVAMSLFVLVEYIRIARLPPVGASIHSFMTSYLDLRDSGFVILTHAYLLLGCALPLWTHLYVMTREKNGMVLQDSFQSNLSFMRALSFAWASLGGSSTDGDAQAEAMRRYGGGGREEAAVLVWDLSVYLPALAGVLVLGIGDSMVRSSLQSHRAARKCENL